MVFFLFHDYSDINECNSNPCENNGNCTDGMNGYSCECVSGFNGSKCEISKEVAISAVSEYSRSKLLYIHEWQKVKTSST